MLEVQGRRGHTELAACEHDQERNACACVSHVCGLAARSTGSRWAISSLRSPRAAYSAILAPALERGLLLLQLTHLWVAEGARPADSHTNARKTCVFLGRGRARNRRYRLRVPVSGDLPQAANGRIVCGPAPYQFVQRGGVP